MEKFALLLTVYVLSNIEPLSTLTISICDCTTPVTGGLLDLKDPEYCFQRATDGEHKKPMTKALTYRLFTRQDYDLKLEALVCTRWKETKRVSGSFWVGAFDTEYFHTTEEVSSEDCWNMKLNLKCGDNTNVKNGKVYSFQHKAIGPGKWMSTKEYTVTNCLAQEIELR